MMPLKISLGSGLLTTRSRLTPNRCAVGSSLNSNVSGQNMAVDKWVVGPEFDEAIFKRLSMVLLNLGYALDGTWWGVGGSQEISQWLAMGPAGNLTIESETYIGLSIEGPAELVAAARQQFLAAR